MTKMIFFLMCLLIFGERKCMSQNQVHLDRSKSLQPDPLTNSQHQQNNIKTIHHKRIEESLFSEENKGEEYKEEEYDDDDEYEDQDDYDDLLKQSNEIGPPDNIKVTVISSNDIKLSWDEPINCQVDVNYTISWGAMGGSTHIIDTSVKSYDFNNLRACTTYIFTVSAVDVNGTSGETDNANGTTFKEEVPPVSSIVTQTITSRSIILSWARPDTNCEIYYIIRWTGVTYWDSNHQTQGQQSIKDSQGGNIQNVNITDLIPMTSYNFTLETSTSTSESQREYYLSEATLHDLPSAFSYVDVIPENHVAISVWWREPDYNGIFKSYTIHWDTGKTAGLKFFTQPQENCTIGNLKSDLEYTVTIELECSGGVKSAQKTVKTKKNLATPLSLGLAIPLFAIGVLIASFIYFKKKNNNTTYNYSRHGNSAPQGTPSQSHHIEKVSGPILKNNFVHHVRQLQKQETGQLRQEYGQILQASNTQGFAFESSRLENQCRIRDINCVPYDSNRVILQNSDDENDFINASHITKPNSRHEFIATQHPLLTTLNDFWRMIWQQDVRTIVTLKDHIKDEQDVDICSSGEDNLTLKHYVVTTHKERINALYTTRLIILNSKTTERTIKQFEIKVPTLEDNNGSSSFIDFILTIRRQNQDDSRILVHCRNGGKYCGIFIALWSLIEEVRLYPDSPTVDVKNSLINLREQRMHMINTEEDYLFLNMCMTQFLKYDERAVNTENDVIYENEAFSLNDEKLI